MDNKTNQPHTYFTNMLLAVMETAVFLKRGPERFLNAAPIAMQSFMIIPLLLPVNLYLLWLIQQDDATLEQIPYIQLATRYVIGSIYVLAISLMLVFSISAHYKKVEFFPRFVCGYNWLGLVSTSLIFPPLLLVAMGFHTISDIQALSLIISIYELMLTVFLIKHSLKIDWIVSCFCSGLIFLMQNLVVISTLNP